MRKPPSKNPFPGDEDNRICLFQCVFVFLNKTAKNAVGCILFTSCRHDGKQGKRNKKENLPFLCRRRCNVEQSERERAQSERTPAKGLKRVPYGVTDHTTDKKRKKSSEINKHTNGAQGRVVALCSHTWPERRLPSVWKHFCSHCAFEGRRGVIGTLRRKEK